MASYKQLVKGNWKVTVSLGYGNDGKRQRVIKQGFKTKKDAEIFVTETLNQRNRGYISPSASNMLFKDFITKWYTEYKQFNIGINTRVGYQSRIKTHIIPMLGNYKLNEITTPIIQDFYNIMISEKKLKPATVKKSMDILISCFKYAKKNKLIYELPTEIEKQKIEKPKIKVWNKDHVQFFLNKIKGTYLYTPIFIDVLTGLRLSELCGLRWCDVDLDNGYLTVNHQLIYDSITKTLLLGGLKTESSQRKISIPTILVNYLKELKEYRKAEKNDYLVLDRNDFKYTPKSLSMNFTKKIAKYKEQLPQITFHGLRHTHATILISNGENIKVVSERLGHTDIRMTLNTYTHVMEDMKNNTASLLDDIFKKDE
ncbi:site-specific integrase [Clostridium botulinum]|nr:site-specific integrase [Clostridium botulinum]NFE84009.1 site-specific integrase [Clostridium botulinum]NFN28095.1 site-specific integrase [Clostridium botulinum]NFO49948.1 site-specific integrase [Clostridium botulinum]